MCSDIRRACTECFCCSLPSRTANYSHRIRRWYYFIINVVCFMANCLHTAIPIIHFIHKTELLLKTYEETSTLIMNYK